MKDSVETSKAVEQAQPRRWGAELKPVVNTSLPAQLAPKLAPATMASVTMASATIASATTVPLAPISIKNQKAVANVSSMEDFPSLGGKSVVKSIAPSGTSFATLSRNWAQQQKEEEKKAKEEAEREAIYKQIQLREREKEEKENVAMSRICLGAIGLLNQKKADSDDEKFFEDDKSVHSEEQYPSDDFEEDVYDDDDEEDESEYVNDGTWNSRKHRDELY